jgi:hypothetical protein
MAAAPMISAAQGTGPMAKAMSIAGLLVGSLVALAFAMDLVLGIPFGGEAPFLQRLGLAVCGAIVAYLGWNSMQEAK